MLFVPLVLAQVASVSSPVATREPILATQVDETVVVTGPSLQATGEALERCLARRCPPAEDIAATMASAEAQLIAGELQGARTTLLRGRHRNKRFAKTLPVPVSDLLTFDAQVASLIGLADYGRIATFDSVSALKAGLPANDPHISAQRLVVGDVFMREGRFNTAVRMYDAVAERAKASGWPEIQGAAMFRVLTFYAMAASVDPKYGDEARRRYAALRATTDPAMRLMRDASVAMEAKLALLVDKNANVDAILKKASGTRSASLIMVMMPPVDLGSDAIPGPLPTNKGGQWADFSYRVTREGHVADVERTGQSAHVSGGWIKSAETALAGRHYLPLDLPPASTGVWRRERFMIVADRVAVTRSRIRSASGRPRLRMIDITPKPEVAPGNDLPPA
jgi:hypothetical protein